MGLTVPGFPNFFMMYGPNTNSVFLAYLFESQAAYIHRCVKRLRRVRTIEVKPRWHRVWNQEIQKRLERTPTAEAIKQGVHSYYATESGRIVANLPIRNFTYGILLRLLGRPSTTTK
jgi:cyclohexanone monooxygenase